MLEFPDMKKEPYTSINPNGRVPAIEDPNTGITLWESSAIIDYLLETYDKSNSLQYTSAPEKFLQKSWMAFQISGQGPYYGQRAWFLFVRPPHIQLSKIGSVADWTFSVPSGEGHQICHRPLRQRVCRLHLHLPQRKAHAFAGSAASLASSTVTSRKPVSHTSLATSALMPISPS